MVTRAQVGNYLQQLEIDEGVTIFYCILGGSRGFNNFNPDSDWDIFFVYDGGSDNYIRRDELFQGEKITFKGYNREIYTEFVQKGINFYAIDGLRCAEVYYDTEDFHNTLLNSIDYDLDEGGRTVFEGIVYRIRRLVKHFYACIVLAGTNVPTKKYRFALYLYVRLLWIEANGSVLYPLNRDELLQDLVDEDWYNEAVNIFSITEQITSRNNIIDELLEQVDI